MPSEHTRIYGRSLNLQDERLLQSRTLSGLCFGGRSYSSNLGTAPLHLGMLLFHGRGLSLLL